MIEKTFGRSGYTIDKKEDGYLVQIWTPTYHTALLLPEKLAKVFIADLKHGWQLDD